MPDLSVPIPTLKFEAIEPGLAVLEKPIEVCCAAVTFPDGTVFDQNNLGTAGFFVYRKQNAASTEIWNEDTKLWEPDPGAVLGSLKPKPLIFNQGAPSPWQFPLVAAGQKDKNDLDQFQKVQKAAPNFPQYFFRAYFASPFLFSIGLEFQRNLDNREISERLRQTFRVNRISLSSNVTVSIEKQGNKWLITDKDNKKTYSVRTEGNQINVYASTDNGNLSSGLSAPSSAIRFASVTDTMRAGIQVGENQKPETATEVLLFLRNDRLELIGSVEIKNVGGLAQIEISNRNAVGAVIRLLPGGDVEIQPRQKLVITGYIEAERIFYQPADSAGTPNGPKQWLDIT